MAPCAPGNRYLVAARTLWLGDLTRVAAHEFDPMGYNVPTKALPYAALWAASYVDPTLANILPNIGVKALTDVERDYQISTRKCARHLGVGFTPIERTVVDACYSVVGHGLVPAAPAFVPQRCPVGERVSTPFGVGTVAGYRPPPPVTAWDGPGGGGGARRRRATTSTTRVAAAAAAAAAVVAVTLAPAALRTAATALAWAPACGKWSWTGCSPAARTRAFS
jgi:hypothetical protein